MAGLPQDFPWGWRKNATPVEVKEGDGLDRYRSYSTKVDANVVLRLGAVLIRLPHIDFYHTGTSKK